MEKVESAEIFASRKSRPQLKLCAHCGEGLSKKKLGENTIGHIIILVKEHGLQLLMLQLPMNKV